MASAGGRALWPSGVVFDLDGTLIDSVGDIAWALNAALVDAGIAPLPEDDVRRIIGRGADVTIARALAMRGAAGGDIRDIHAAFLRHYASAPADRTVLYPGASELLANLASQGTKLAICTNKPEALTTEILAALDVSHHFSAVVGASDRLPRKPDPAMLQHATEGMALGPADVVMVGDSATDVATARALGVPVVAVSFGYTAVPARDLGADDVIDSLADLPRALATLRPPPAPAYRD